MHVVHHHDVPLRQVDMEGAEGVAMGWIISARENAANFYMRVFELAEGGHTPHHKHQWEHEVFVVEGQIELRTEQGNHQLDSGHAALVDSGIIHSFHNAGEGKSRFLCMVPSSAEG